MGDTKQKRVIVILAGGRGTRLWPLSVGSHPKHLLSLYNTNSLLQNTYGRAFSMGAEVLVVTEEMYANETLAQIPALEGRIIVEPRGSGTAAAVAYAVAYIHSKFGPEVTIGFLPVDHHVKNERAWRRSVSAAFAAAEGQRALTLIGAPPTYPATGFGYIKLAARFAQKVQWHSAFRVDVFREKPKPKIAERYFKSGEYVWNSGLFFAPLRVFEEAFSKTSKLLERYYRSLLKSEKQFTSRHVGAAPLSLRGKVFEKVVAEKVGNSIVVLGTFQWKDIGSYQDLFEILKKSSSSENILEGDVTQHDCKGCIIKAKDKPIIALGLDEIVVIDRPQGILICKRTTHSQDVGTAVSEKTHAE